MEEFILFATPWWINLLVLVPIISYYFWRKKRLKLSWQTLAHLSLFGIAFGFVEASVVVYLQAAIGLLPSYAGSLSDIANLSMDAYQPVDILANVTDSLVTVEFFKEVATMAMLISLAYLAAKNARDRWAAFLWTFAVWDIFYYVGLWVTVRWPQSLLSPDLLFLIPVPWFSQVWYPILVSGLTIGAVLLVKQKH